MKLMKTQFMVLVEPFPMQLQEFSVPGVGPKDLLLKVQMVGVCGGNPSA